MGDPIQEVIGGRTYTTEKLGAIAGVTLMPRVLAMVGQEVFSLMFGTSVENRKNLLKDPKVRGALLAGISEKLTALEAETGKPPLLVFHELLKKTECDKVRIGDTEVGGNVHTHFDTHFAGDYAHLLEVVIWVGTVNFIGPSTENR
jgi:hypothetical protein